MPRDYTGARRFVPHACGCGAFVFESATVGVADEAAAGAVEPACLQWFTHRSIFALSATSTPPLTRRDGAQPAADTLAAHSKTYNSLAHKGRLGIVFFGIIPSSSSVRLNWNNAVDQNTSPTDAEKKDANFHASR